MLIIKSKCRKPTIWKRGIIDLVNLRELHPWDVTPQEAAAIQARLSSTVERSDRLGPLRRVAGLDVGFEADGRLTRAAVVVLSFPDLQPEESCLVRLPTRFPYVPGLLSFREAPAILAALEQLKTLPDLLVCDGQGLAHPRRFGLACHLGLLCDLPSIGVAKSRLIGQHSLPGEQRGDWQPLMDSGEVIGAVLRTRSGARPVYVSIGHRCSLETAIKLTLLCTPKYRLPETTRHAHHLASAKVS